MGLLVKPDAKILRNYFKEMAKLVGQEVYYRYPLPGKNYTIYTEIDANYGPLIKMDAIFEEYPNQKTLRKEGWFSEGEDQWTDPIIHVPYDTEHLQQGSLFIIPSGIDGARGRLFRVTDIRTIMQFPDRCLCRLVPEYETTVQPSQHVYDNTRFNYLKDQEGED